MKKIDFTQPGGFPLRQDTLRFMQDGYNEAIKAFIAYLGEEATTTGLGLNVIISGLNPSVFGGNENDPFITPGWIVKSGELLRFEGALLSQIENAGGIGIQEFNETAVFHDETEPTVYFSKKAVAGGTYPLPIEFFHRAKKQRFYRNILAINFTKQTNPVVAGAQASITYQNENIKMSDVVVVQLRNPNQDSGRLIINAEVIQDGLVVITFINMNQTDEILGGNIAFKMRVFK